MAYVSWRTMMGVESVGNEAVFLARGFFESAQDLDWQSSSIGRPHTVTNVLTQCLKQPTDEQYTDDELWAWTLPQRLQGLVAIVIASGQSTMQALEQCSACGETMELELELSTFIDTNFGSEILIEPEPGTCLMVAIPTGRHQLELLEAGDTLSEEDHFQKIATTLTQTINGEAPASDWILPKHWLTEFQMELEKQDPLTAFNLCMDCPSCAKSMDVELDLEELLLKQLERAQKSLLEEVYYLARVYHWTEEDIISMPAWRRRFYIRRCQQEMQ